MNELSAPRSVVRLFEAAPAGVRQLMGSADPVRVWRNEIGVETFRAVGQSAEPIFIKVAPVGTHPPLSDEAQRLDWARDYLPVPEVLAIDVSGTNTWLVTRGLPGKHAATTEHTDAPGRTVGLLARALAAFHQAPVQRYPFRFSLNEALALVSDRVARGLVVPEKHFHPCHAHLTVTEALDRLVRDRPADEDLVVCHGDYCFPNVLIERGSVSGYVDLGELGVADRWWDLAVASWSTVWNVGEGWEREFVEAYGAKWDQARIDYYRLLYDLAS